MQLLLTFDNSGVIEIPVNYNYYVQSAIFSLLANEDADYANQLHNIAYGEKSKYKFFTFGKLNGINHFHEKKLCFDGDIKLEIRSASDEFLQILTDSIMKAGIMRIGKHMLQIKQIVGLDYRISTSLIHIKTVTPIITKDQIEGRKTVYYSPNDVRFIRKIREAFESKYEVRCGRKPESTIDILPVGENQKVVTKYKNIWINAYHGHFQLYGESDNLQFLYDVGLGAKTSQGFGMFDVIEQ